MGQVAERAINTVVNMASAILMQAWMICHKNTLYIDLANGNGLFCMDLKLDHDRQYGIKAVRQV